MMVATTFTTTLLSFFGLQHGTLERIICKGGIYLILLKIICIFSKPRNDPICTLYIEDDHRILADPEFVISHRDLSSGRPSGLRISDMVALEVRINISVIIVIIIIL